jgi:Ca2+-transporting ATPase
VAACRRAGIRPLIVTGDHPLTAAYVARELGLPDGPVLTGRDLDRMPPEELAAAADRTAIFARVSPAHKLAIVTALQRRGHLVAMTGDGVNDAPALRRADLGVAMGMTGTDVAKEAADLVLLDDNFATIVAAVEEGRTVYGNIRKFVRYLLTSNAGELWVMLLGPLLGMPLPLLPLQILWINLVTDGLPALALSVQPGEPETMRRPPRRRDEPIVDRPMLRQILWVGLLTGVVSVAAGAWYWAQDAAHWQTVLFTTVVCAQMAIVLAIRSDRPLARLVRSDWRLLAAVGVTIALQLAVVYVPALQAIFGTRPLAPVDLALAALAGGLVFAGLETEKLLARRARGGGRGV